MAKCLVKTIQIPEGYLDYETDKENLFILHLKVKPEHRNKGYGSILMKKIISIAKKKHCKVIHVDALPLENNNSKNIKRLVRLYKRFGFKVVAQMKIGETMKLTF